MDPANIILGLKFPQCVSLIRMIPCFLAIRARGPSSTSN